MTASLPLKTTAPKSAPASSLSEAARLRSLAERLISENRPGLAIDHLEHALSLEPESALSWFLMGAAMESRGDYARAVENYQRCTRQDPDWAESWFQLGMSLLRLENYDQGAEALGRAVCLRPDWAAAWLNFGCALSGAGRCEEAFEAWQHSLGLYDQDALTHYNCGCHYQNTGRFTEAVAAYTRAVQLTPEMMEAHLGLGVCHQTLGDLETALSCYQKTVALAPRHLPGWHHLAEVLAMRKQYNEAIEAYRQALAIDTDHALTHFNLTVLLARRWRIDEALEHSQKALEIRPDDGVMKATQYELARHGCRWSLAKTLASELDRLTARELSQGIKTSEWPLLSLWRHDDPERNLAVAAAWSRAEEKRCLENPDRPHFTHSAGGRCRRRIRIGYLSGDFKVHAVAHQIRGMLRHHDRSRFEIHGYATNPSDGSDYREQLIQACDRFTPIEKLPGLQAAQKIHEDGIDILVDLSGHTMGGRMDILSLRPAPVQISYLGFLGSSGSACIDYFITDHVVTPPGHEAFFTEKLIYMPHCYQANDDEMAISSQPFKRADMHLPQEAVIFCCFNQPFKIDRATFECWMRILSEVPRSVLWLLDHNQAARQNLSSAAQAVGIAPSRLIFSEPTRIDLHLARLRLADLALDTFYYNGGATTANALWSGVPLVALMGKHLVSRMSASALKAVGLPELATQSPRDYRELAIELGTHPERRSQLRRKLASQRSTAPLFDTRLFTRHLESAFETVIHRFEKDLPPISLEIGSTAYPSTQERETAEAAQELNSMPAATDSPIDFGRMAIAAQEAIQREDLGQAADIYGRMLTKAPQSADLHYLIGLVHAERHQWPEARQSFARAIELDADKATFHHGLGNALQAQGELDAAGLAYRQALKLKPDDVDSWINLGNTLYRQRDIEAARQCYEHALRWAPNNAIAMNNLGKSWYDHRKIGEALQWYGKALQIDPGYAEAHFNRAAAWLLCGDFKRGWPEYEWRFKRRQAAQVYPHHLPGPRWQGEPYAGARLLVHCEQGMGDVLQFARFLPRIKALGGTLLLEAHAPLISLLKTMPAADRIIPFSAQAPTITDYDLHIAMQSLPLVLGTPLSEIACDIPYLQADPTKAARWRQRLAGPHLRIGLVWSCSDITSYRESRLEYLLPLLELPGIQWYSLQKGSAAAQLSALPAESPSIHHLGDDLHDFSDTAAVLANLNLLITVDTAVAHVAGAMNVPVWVMLPFAGDWRWLLHPTRTPWYPSARLFRQTRPGDWAGAVSRVRAELWDMCRHRTRVQISGSKGATACA